MAVTERYHRVMKNRVVTVTEFKARCLALLDEVGRKGGTITVTKRGTPMASVGPVEKRRPKSPERAWAGKVYIPQEELIADTADSLDVVRHPMKTPACRRP